ncbi:MAG: molybdopterin/thiamine biosynthesis adenylyltransferase, partial [bacterium]
MVIRVCVSSLLCRFTDGQTEISLTVEGRTIKSMLKVLWKKYPNLQQQLKSSDGHLSNMVQIFVNRRNISVLQGLESNITDHDTVNISLLSDDLSVLPELNPQEMLRYSRHLSLPEIQEEGQRKLKAARVLIVGAGGLGCPASLYLAAAGVGIIGLIDDDVVDNSNLQRQILYSVDSIGVSKVEEAKSRLSSLNPHIQIFTYKEKFTVENALEIVREYDLVIDGTDNFATRYLVNDACVMLSKPYFYGSIFRFDGQASVFNYQGGPCYRCIFPDPPEPDMVPSCSEGGVLGVLPSIIGSIQATEAIKVITEAGVTLAGRLL